MVANKLAWRRPRLARLVAIAIALTLPAWGYADENVLILNSYHRGKTLSDETIDSIVTELRKKHPELTFLTEDMDTKRNSLETLRVPLLKFYTQKYRDVKLRVIVTVDNNAFDFVMENRQALFPGVPVVFCGYNGFLPSILDGVEGVTGVTEAIDLESTVKVALALHPKTTHLAVVAGTRPSAIEVLGEFRQYAKTLPKSLEIVELTDVTSAELTAKLKALPRDSVVLRFSFFRDAAGRSFRVDEQVTLLTQSGLPVYDFWDEGGIGSGYVGGYVLVGRSQGRVVASMMDRILAGEAPEQIKIVDRSPNIPVFDKRALLRTGADMNQLPANAVVRFDEASFWERNGQLLIGTGIAFLVLLGFAIFFAVLSALRKTYAQSLCLEEQKLRATIQSIGEGVVTTNTRGEVEQFNSVAEEWTGLSFEEARGRPVDEVLQLTDCFTDKVVDLNSGTGAVPSAAGRLKTSDGNSLHIVRTAAPISLLQGEEAGTVIVFRDMTREHELQQEIEQVRRLDALGQLAGGMAHDFNNILGGLIGAAENIIHQPDNRKLREFPQLVLESANGAAELTVQLLSFANKQSIAKQSIHFNRIIVDTVAVLSRTIDRRIQIDVQTESENDIVMGDQTLLKSCLLNLGINASHAMPSGGNLAFKTREVRLQSNDCEESSFDILPGRYLELSVEDTGTGIEPEVIERIFEPFFTTKELETGNGLGLAAVFGTVQQHNGSVTVESEPGRGTTFVIRLPLAAPPLSPPRKLEESEEIETTAEDVGVILVVDDDDLLRTMAANTLESFGYEVLTANDGLEAVEVYGREHERIDVVLLDMVMPRMGGRDCFIELQRLSPEVRIVATSGFSFSDDLQEMRRLGLTAQLPKPYRRAELSKVISNAMQGGKNS